MYVGDRASIRAACSIPGTRCVARTKYRKSSENEDLRFALRSCLCTCSRYLDNPKPALTDSLIAHRRSCLCKAMTSCPAPVSFSVLPIRHSSRL